jgi:hypothetical protein
MNTCVLGHKIVEAMQTNPITPDIENWTAELDPDSDRRDFSLTVAVGERVSTRSASQLG